MRYLAGIAMAAALSACASVEQTGVRSSPQASVFVAGDQSAPVQPMPAMNPNAEPGLVDVSALKRLYWFLAGR